MVLIYKARLAEIRVLTIGQSARTPGGSLEPLLGRGIGQKLGVDSKAGGAPEDSPRRPQLSTTQRRPCGYDGSNVP